MLRADILSLKAFSGGGGGVENIGEYEFINVLATRCNRQRLQ